MILGILQARCTSSRLPGKVLMPILGEPMLARQLERILRSRGIDRLVLATSVHPSDDPLERLGGTLGVPTFRGSLEDVLDRFYRAAAPHAPDHVVRLTGDCPLADPEVIDQVIRLHLEGEYDYTSNVLPPTFPDGLDVEVFRMSSLEQAWREATLPSQREHVTPFINRQPDRFRMGLLRNSPDLSSLRWTVDEPDDFELVSRIYAELHPRNPSFSMKDILGLLEAKPELKTSNTGHRRNEGYQKSLAADKKVEP